MFTSCASKNHPSKSTRQRESNTPKLVFQSGFEDGSRVIAKGSNNDIVGKDNSLTDKNDWVKDLEINAGTNFSIEYTGGDSSKRNATIVAEWFHLQPQVLLDLKIRR